MSKTGIELISKERQRQIEKEGWTPEHDNEHTRGELALAAVCYATPEPLYKMETYANQMHFGDPWPWMSRFDKRTHCGNVVVANWALPVNQRIELLVKAGALIAAEIDRLQPKEAR